VTMLASPVFAALILSPPAAHDGIYLDSRKRREDALSNLWDMTCQRIGNERQPLSLAELPAAYSLAISPPRTVRGCLSGRLRTAPAGFDLAR